MNPKPGGRASLPANTTAGTETRPAFWRDILHLSILVLLAIVQPLFNVLSHSPEFFIVRGNRPVDIVMLVVALCFILPAAFALIEILFRLISPTLQKAVHIILMFVLLVVMFGYGLKQSGLISGSIVLLCSCLFAALLLLIYIRYHPVRVFFTYLLPAFVFIPVLFLSNPKISQLLKVPDFSTAMPAVHSNVPVVLIIFDEFSLGSLLDENASLDAAAFPNFAAFAAQSTWYRNVTAVSDHTEDVVPAILSGIYPRQKRSPTAWDHPQNLFALLQNSYELKVMESLTRILSKTPTNISSFTERMRSLFEDAAAIYLQSVLPSQFARHFPAINQTWQDFWKGGSAIQTKKFEGRGGRFEEFIASITPSKKTPLYFLHTVLPHGPWEYFPSGVRYNFGRWTTPLAAEDNLQDWNGNQLTATRAYQRYLLQVAYVDLLIGKTMKRLKEIGIYDRALIIMIADHGISFLANQKRRALTMTNVEDILMVPLFIKYPNQHQSKIDDRPAESIDILPTITEILKVKLPWRQDGVSLVSENRVKRQKKTTFGWFGSKGKVFQINQPEIRNSPDWKRKIQLFGSGPIEKVFRYGANADLVGRSLIGFPIKDDLTAKIELQNGKWYQSVNPDSGFLPAQVTAKIRNQDEGQKVPIAIAMNGKICAVAEQFNFGEQSAIVSITPEDCFQRGHNELQFFFVRKEPAVHLYKISLQPSR